MSQKVTPLHFSASASYLYAERCINRGARPALSHADKAAFQRRTSAAASAVPHSLRWRACTCRSTHALGQRLNPNVHIRNGSRPGRTDFSLGPKLRSLIKLRSECTHTKRALPVFPRGLSRTACGSAIAH